MSPIATFRCRLAARLLPLAAGLSALACRGGETGEFTAKLSGGATGEFSGGAVFCNEDRGYGPVLLIRLRGDGLDASFDRTDPSLPRAGASVPFLADGVAEPAEGFQATVVGIPWKGSQTLELSPRGGEVRFDESGRARLRGSFRLRGALGSATLPEPGAPQPDTAALLQGTFTARGVPCDSVAP